MALIPPGFRIDLDEWSNILTSIVAIALSLTFASGGIQISPSEFVFLMIAFGITVGSGFLLHELAHKYTAIRFGLRARFEAWVWGLVLMLGLAIIPQLVGWGMFPLFLAPGAVMIYGNRQISQKENGIISAAGPITNILLGLLFFALAVLIVGIGAFGTVIPYGETAAYVMLMGTQVNMFLALFNLLPIFPLDGSKVFAWSWKIWLALFAIAFIGSGVFGF
ncbi:MAG: M50 family metallopeptidase [Candidatus Micrarchaeia archaeon]